MRVCFQPVAFVGKYIRHKTLLIEYSMRLTSVSSLNGLQLVMGLYSDQSSLFLRVYLP